MSRVVPYKSASIAAIKTGTINAPGEPNHGKPAIIKVFREYASQGYKSKYDLIERLCLFAYVDGDCVFKVRSSGRNIEKVWTAYNDMASIITA